MSLPIPPAEQSPVKRLEQIVTDLRSPEGCPWDKEQTQISLIPCMLEEVQEAAHAIRKESPEAACDELGDLLLQVVMQAQVAEENGLYNFDSVASAICEKLIRRHPHVYGTDSAKDSKEVLVKWEEIKNEEGANSAPLSQAEEVAQAGRGLSALQQAQKIQKKAAKLNFDWPNAEGALEKVKEETKEIAHCLAEGDTPQRLEEELSDLLFSVVNLCRKIGLDAESTLLMGNAKFGKRFTAMAEKIETSGKTLQESSLEEMEQAWQQIK